MLSAPLMFALSAVPSQAGCDTFLSLNLLLNESPLRSRRSICVSTGAPFLPLTSGGLAASPCRATNITTGLSVQVPSICRSSRCRWRLVFDENSGRPTGSIHLYVARTARAAFGGSRPRLSAAPGLCTAVANACAGGWSCGSAPFCAACAMLRGAPCICGPRAVGRTSTGRAEVALCAANVSRHASGLVTAVY